MPAAQNAPANSANPSYPAAPNATPAIPTAPSLNGTYAPSQVAPPPSPQYQPLPYQQPPSQYQSQPSYQQPPAGPYAPPAPAPRPVSSRWSHTNEMIGGTLGGIFIITVIVLRIYLAVDRVARRDAINQSYAAARQNSYNSTPDTVFIERPAQTIYVNSQPSFPSDPNAGQYAAQQAQNRASQNMQRLQDMQQQNMQRLQNMQQNRPTFGGGFGHRPGF